MEDSGGAKDLGSAADAGDGPETLPCDCPAATADDGCNAGRRGAPGALGLLLVALGMLLARRRRQAGTDAA